MGDSSLVEEPPKYESKRTVIRYSYPRMYEKLCQGKNITLWH